MLIIIVRILILEHILLPAELSPLRITFLSHYLSRSCSNTTTFRTTFKKRFLFTDTRKSS